ncbi:kinase-like domain-containing protein, partial [Lineolata rhizophorae]
PDQAKRPGSRQGLLNRRPSRKVVPGLPRPITFRRQNSERRERLMPVQPCAAERRAVSVDRRGGDHGARRAMSPPPMNMPSLSAPEVGRSECEDAELTEMERIAEESLPNDDEQRYPDQRTMDQEGEPPPAQATPLAASGVDPIDPEDSCSEVDDGALQVEADAKWILNLSMHFRDKSDREKFFITYAEEPNKWRRVTVSLDYRDAPPESLEADLKGLHFQRDKSFHIYESIRDSLADIQFYDTVTNLKLVTTPDGRLHVHVTEDINEVIPYPPTNSISHLDCRHFKESDVVFDSHISGFVYKVKAGGVTCIKKEIPGPDSVEEFLYEINALRTLGGSKAVINFEGVIVDDQARYVKGLLISYADRGALVDLLYDLRGTNELPWTLRERWARQIIEGLSEIHESGFVQGDFTLSNIVINSKDEAKIIDINRRGCPVGWEPPEMDPLIDSGQRVSIYIGVKSDLYQLGMVLWAIAAQEDEPERQDRTELLQVQTDERFAEIPQYYKDIVAHCLSRDPRNRLQAKELLKLMDD